MFNLTQFFFDVIIIGAGLSGLSSLSYIKQNSNLSVIILEQNDYIGGRVESYMFQNNLFSTINLGAKWIENTKNNPFYDCCIKNKISGSFSNNSNIIAVDSGNYFYPNELTILQNYYLDLVKLSNFDNSYKISIRDSLEMLGWKNNTHIKNLLEYYFFDFEFGESPEYTSLRALSNDVEDQDYFFITDPSGLHQGIMNYVTSFNLNGHIKLNQNVYDVEKINDLYVVNLKDEKYFTKNVIYTGSLGTLKKTFINKLLPDETNQVINKYNYVDFLTIFLKYDNIFWDNSYEYFINVNNIRGNFSLFMNLGHTKYYNKPYLMTIVTSDYAIYIETLNESLIKDMIDESTSLMFNQKIKSTNIYVSRWNKKDNFRGSFSDWNKGLSPDELLGLSNDFDGLFLAGEHTSIDNNGYLQGAYESGQIVGRNIVDKLK